MGEKYKRAVGRSVLALMSAVCAAAAWPQAPGSSEPSDEAVAQARALVEEILGKAGAADGGELESWAPSVVGEALTRAGVVGDAAGDVGALPAEHAAVEMAGSLSPGRARTAEIIVFASLSVPEQSWRQWGLEASRIGTPLVLRGVAEGGFAATANRIAVRGLEDGAGVVVDPRLFRLFRISHVPAVAVVPGGVPPCESPGCSGDAAPPHDLVSGNVGLEGALRAIAREGGPGRETARRYLAVLREEAE